MGTRRPRLERRAQPGRGRDGDQPGHVDQPARLGTPAALISPIDGHVHYEMAERDGCRACRLEDDLAIEKARADRVVGLLNKQTHERREIERDRDLLRVGINDLRAALFGPQPQGVEDIKATLDAIVGVRDPLYVQIEGETYRGELVAATRDDVAPGSTAVFDDGSEVVVDEWITIRCAGCKETANTPTPPNVADAGRNPDGTYRGLCPRCASR